MTSAQPNQASSSPPRDAAAADTDPLLHLHKMSMTAGLGSQDYVAVNVTAIVAAITGLASVLAIAVPVFLVIPMIGVVLGIVALRQINDSNGTQTGRFLAIGGLLLSIGIAVGLLSVEGIEALHRRGDEKAIAALAEQYGQFLHDHKYAEAYELFDGDFKARVPISPFKIHLASIQGGTYAPPIVATNWNGLAEFQSTDPNSEIAESTLVIHYKGTDMAYRMGIRFRKDDGVWRIDNIPEQFPAVPASRMPR